MGPAAYFEKLVRLQHRSAAYRHLIEELRQHLDSDITKAAKRLADEKGYVRDVQQEAIRDVVEILADLNRRVEREMVEFGLRKKPEIRSEKHKKRGPAAKAPAKAAEGPS